MTRKLLSTEQEAQLKLSRNWVLGHVNVSAIEKYQSVEGRIRLIQTILDNKWIENHETWKLQSLGVVFGDALAQELMLEWIWVQDDYGEAIALNWPGTSIDCFPQTMISKRIEDGDVVDVALMYREIYDRLKALAFSGDAV